MTFKPYADSLTLNDSLINSSLTSHPAEAFWRHQFGVAENVQEDFKTPELPLARVKRVMKTDPEVSVSLHAHCDYRSQEAEFMFSDDRI
jgi:hypothetical protein